MKQMISKEANNLQAYRYSDKINNVSRTHWALAPAALHRVVPPVSTIRVSVQAVPNINNTNTPEQEDATNAHIKW